MINGDARSRKLTVFGDHTGRKTKACAIRSFDHFVVGIEFQDGHHRTEDLNESILSRRVNLREESFTSSCAIVMSSFTPLKIVGRMK